MNTENSFSAIASDSTSSLAFFLSPFCPFIAIVWEDNDLYVGYQHIIANKFLYNPKTR